MTEEWPEEFTSLSKAAKYAHTCRQAIFVAISKGQLKAEKRLIRNERGALMNQWFIKRTDIDEYRQSKYNRDKRMVEGEKLFDIENDKWSVLHAAKTLSSMLRKPYPAHHLYYLLRVGKLRAKKKAGAWVIGREELLRLYYEKSDKNDKQMEFAT